MGTYFHRNAAPFWMGKELPKHILYLYKGDFDREWKEYTIYDLIRDKVKKQERNLWRKRVHRKKVPCYICVHKLYDTGRWYIMIITLKNRIYVYDKLAAMVRQKYSCGVFPEFANEWAEAFYRKYKTNNKTYAKRSLKMTHCVFDEYNNLIEVL